MAGSNGVIVKKALLARIGDLPELAGVTVSYGYVGNLFSSSLEYVFGGGRVGGPVVFSAMQDASGGGRVKRTEQPTMSIHVRCKSPNEATAELAETRALNEIGGAIENMIALDPTLGKLPGLGALRITDFESITFADDSAAYCELDYTLMFESYLT